MVLLLVLVALIAVIAAGTWVVGYRPNFQTASVPIPPSNASPVTVVRSYVGAYNHRDFTTMTALYPSMRSFDQSYRHRALGTMKDLKVTGSRHDGAYGRQSPRWTVGVEVNFTGLRWSDISYEPGHNGWNYDLQRIGPHRAWRIVDEGVG